MRHSTITYLVLISLIIIFSNEVIALEKSLKSDNKSSESAVNNKSILRLSVPKCCDIDEVVIMKRGIENCQKYSAKLNFSMVELYNDNLLETGRFLPDVYDMEPEGKFRNETFKNFAINFARMKHRHYLTENGILYREQPNFLRRWYSYDKSSFCIDFLLLRDKIPRFRFWIIATTRNPEKPLHASLVKIGLLTSCAFLFLTLLVYVLLPELRNLKGLMLMAYVFSLFSAFLLLALVKWISFYSNGCKAMTYAIYFFFLSSFSWMTIMSFDIWWNFKNAARGRPPKRSKRREELYKFGVYCLFAFGLPLPMTIALGVLDNITMTHIPWFVIPNIPNQGCFLGEDPRIVYLYTPMFIMIICNWLFFLMTVFNLCRVYRSTIALDVGSAEDPGAHRKLTKRLLLYLKISIIMGINWLLEVISALQPDLDFWYIGDIYNVFIGVSIFLIHIFKKDILKKLKKRFRRISKSARRMPGQQYSTSRSTSHSSTDTEVTQDTQTPLVCASPNGPSYSSKTKNI